ncbi:MAG TPA: Rap1a/Tai family immunity protein [Syntrophales bacterium]|nr:Rap1a/Tai family immunity protein [Syntrophales bacterium]
MKKILSIIVISLLYVTPCFAESTLEILLACKGFLKDYEQKGTKKSSPATSDSELCRGAFMVIQNILYYYEADGTPILRACVPKEVSRPQLISGFVKYAEDNKRRLREDFTMTAVNYIQDTYPCKKVSKDKKNKKK